MTCLPSRLLALIPPSFLSFYPWHLADPSQVIWKKAKIVSLHVQIAHILWWLYCKRRAGRGTSLEVFLDFDSLDSFFGFDSAGLAPPPWPSRMTSALEAVCCTTHFLHLFETLCNVSFSFFQSMFSLTFACFFCPPSPQAIPRDGWWHGSDLCQHHPKDRTETLERTRQKFERKL